MRSLADKVLGKLHFDLEQVQDLTPTPMTFSSVMFYTGENPYTGAAVAEARSLASGDLQRTAQLIDNQCGKCLAIHIFGDNQQRASVRSFIAPSGISLRFKCV